MTTGKSRPKIGTGQNSMKGRWSSTNGQKTKTHNKEPHKNTQNANLIRNTRTIAKFNQRHNRSILRNIITTATIASKQHNENDNKERKFI